MKKGKSKLPEFWYKAFRPIMRLIFNTYYHPTYIGKENIPSDVPIIIAANHKHLMDQCGPILATG